MGHVDRTSKFINDNMLLIIIAAPKFGARIFRISVRAGLLPRTVALPSPSWTPVDITAPLDTNWLHTVSTDTVEVRIITNVNITGDPRELTGRCQ
jgi:hypothetical protein